MVEFAWDGGCVGDEAALARLEDVLVGLPGDRVLPDLDDLLGRAKMTPGQVADDPRVAALLVAAARARPWGDDDEREAVRTQVSLLELELGVLCERLTGDGATAEVLDRTVTRLRRIREELQGLSAPL